MFGLLRLLLASGVMLSHLDVKIAGFNPGVTSVVVFFILSGRVTTQLIEQNNGVAHLYYLERFLRLYPAYVVVLIISIITWYIFHVDSVFVSRAPTAYDWFANITIVPLDFETWRSQTYFILIPPAWSLGLEIQFYILAPWALRLEPTVFAKIVLLSAAIWCAAQVNLVDSDNWGYRFIPGTLFMFLSGGLIHQRRHGLLAILWTIALLTLVGEFCGFVAVRDFNVETSFAFVVGVPLVMALSLLPRKAWDEYLGGLSYPLFLIHFPVIWLFRAQGLALAPANDYWMLGLLLGVAVGASAAVHRVAERPLMKLRYALRERPIVFGKLGGGVIR
jgi:peptidoglycan/LPS O-acetylase OafA/YrhL